jgi:hypothetical protein
MSSYPNVQAPVPDPNRNSKPKPCQNSTRYPIPQHDCEEVWGFGFPLKDKYVEQLEEKLHPIPPNASKEDMIVAIGTSTRLTRSYWRKLCETVCPEYRIDLPIAIYKKNWVPLICLADTVNRTNIPPQYVLDSLKEALIKDGWKGRLGWYELYEW